MGIFKCPLWKVQCVLNITDSRVVTSAFLEKMSSWLYFKNKINVVYLCVRVSVYARAHVFCVRARWESRIGIAVGSLKYEV